MTYRMTVLTEQPEREAQAPVISFQKFPALNGQFGTIPMNTGMWHSTNHQPSQRGPEGLEGNYESPLLGIKPPAPHSYSGYRDATLGSLHVIIIVFFYWELSATCSIFGFR